MAQASIIQDVSDRVETALKNAEKDFRRLQKRAEKQRKDFEKRAERRIKKIRAELRKNDVVKWADDLGSEAIERAEGLRDDAVKAWEDRVDAVLGSLRIASHGEVIRLERKVGQLNRKVRQLEKLHNGSAA
jgi:polyhydroxyalkanoate synthesis regulator phasin